MSLIPEWRKAWKLTSVQLAVLGALLNTLAGCWPAFQAVTSPMVFVVVNTILLCAVAVSRVVKQPALEDKETDHVQS